MGDASLADVTTRRLDLPGDLGDRESAMLA
jgi:hypothetical protein